MPHFLAHKAAALLLAFSLTAAAQTSPQIPPPQDKPYPGTITVEVDATDLDHKIFQVRQTLPVKPGALTLLYPRWIPGTHGPWGDPSQIAGIVMRANGKMLPWRRDASEPHAFHVDVPAGSPTLEVTFQHLAPTGPDSGRRVVMTREMLGLQWNQVLLYPAGHHVSAINVQPRLKLPAGWQYGSALRAAAPAPQDGWIAFAPVSLETLVDSPLFAGRHFKRVELDAPGAARPVVLNVMTDEATQLDASDEQWEAHRRLVQQADRLFGARPFRHYDFLLALSERFGGIGLEHHESSENAVKPTYFKDWAKAARERELLPHEYAHTWNGKFRRPAELTTPNYNVPMRNSLLWVYEGQTQYWGRVLAARSGLVTAEQAREGLARAAAWLEHRVGRDWRNLQDTTNEPALASARTREWRSWQRDYDYYDEGTLVWLDVDTLLREKSNGQRSLDDFARAFLGRPGSEPATAPDGRVRPVTYTFDDIVKALNAVQPHDWAKLLRERLDGHAVPFDGLARSGWKLVYVEQQSEADKTNEADHKFNDFSYSIGLQVEHDGKLSQVLWNSPAFRAGIAPGVTLVAVNGVAYKAERLTGAISANKTGTQPIELLLRDGEQFRTVRIDYRGGLRYPKLERVETQPDRLSEILAPR